MTGSGLAEPYNRCFTTALRLSPSLSAEKFEFWVKLNRFLDSGDVKP